MSTLLQDFRLGIRFLRQQRGYVAVAVLTMAVGLGSVTTILSATDATLLRSLPYAEADGLVQVFSSFRPRTNMNRMGVPPANYADWRQASGFSGMAAFRLTNLTMTGEGPAERIRSAQVSAELFTVLGVSPAMGRTLSSDDDTAGADSAAVISDGLWSRRFDRHPSVLGQRLRTPTTNYTVVGVMPRAFKFPIGWIGTTDIDVWTPLRLSDRERTDRRTATLNVIARLAPGSSVGSAQAALDILTRDLEQEHPSTNKDWGTSVMALNERGLTNIRPLLRTLLATVFVLLTIACVNVANLLLTRGIERQGALTIHSALGASRARLVRALLIEGLLLATMGGVLGTVLAWWGIDALRAIAPTAYAPELRDMRLSWSVLGGTMTITALTGLLCAAIPVFASSQLKLRDTLDQRLRVGSSRHGRGGRSALVIAEIALTLVLLASATLVVRGYSHFMAIDPGFDSAGAISMRVSLQGPRYSSPETWTAYFERLRDDLAQLPGVESAGLAASVPMGGSGEVSRYRILGEKTLDPSGPGPIGMELNRISPEYLAAAGMTLLRGRTFQQTDVADATPVALVNEAFVRRAFSGGEAIGRHIVLQGDMNREASAVDNGPALEIVGVVRDVKEYGLHLTTPPAVYVPVRQNPSRTLSVLLRSLAGLTPDADLLRHRLHSIDPDQAALSVESLQATFDRSHSLLTFQTVLLVAAAVVAATLAFVGLFSVVSYGAAHQSKEWALRLALGATSASVFKRVVSRSAGLATGGLVAGSALAPSVLALLTRTMKAGMNIDLPAASPSMWVQLVTVVVVIAIVAGVLPARRAMQNDPAAVLRND